MSICYEKKNLKCLNLEYLIEKYPNWMWDMGFISNNNSISPEFIERHLNGFPSMYSCRKWNINKLSKNPSITPEFKIGRASCRERV